MQSLVKIKHSQIGDITLPFTDIGKSCPVREVFTSRMYLLTLSAKISEFTVNKSMVDIYSIMSPSFFLVY